MLIEHILSVLRQLKLDGMARAFQEQVEQPGTVSDLPFDERFGIIADRELNHRDSRRVERLLKNAKLKFPSACIEDIEYHASRGVERSVIKSLATGDWIRHGQSITLTGSTGVGKTWLACALCHQACRQGFSALYVRASRLFEELRIAHGDGSFQRRLSTLAKLDILFIDDFALAPIGAAERNDLLEVLDDRIAGRSTIITSQRPTKTWHEYLNEPTVADAILDRILHRAHKLVLGGESRRKRESGKE